MSYVAFLGTAQIAAGSLSEVALAAHRRARDTRGAPRIFADATGEVVPFDLHGTPVEVLARVAATAAEGEAEREAAAARGPGRPRLGVVSKEVTLLPRHWAWLGAQRGSVSATLRRLIDEARHLHEGRDAVRRSQDAAYRFVSAMAGSEPTFEEAIRALYRGDADRFEREIAAWPPDVRAHSRKLAAGAFRPPSSAAKPELG